MGHRDESSTKIAFRIRAQSANPAPLVGEPSKFQKDRPDFMIRDFRTDSILFVGRLVEPKQRRVWLSVCTMTVDWRNRHINGE
jgi:serine protease inhibitor